jgi:hypothetical protein
MARKAEKRTGVRRDGEKGEWQKELDKELSVRYVLYREKQQK